MATHTTKPSHLETQFNLELSSSSSVGSLVYLMECHSATTGPVQVNVLKKGTIIGRSIMNTFWQSMQHPQVMEEHIPVM